MKPSLSMLPYLLFRSLKHFCLPSSSLFSIIITLWSFFPHRLLVLSVVHLTRIHHIPTIRTNLNQRKDLHRWILAARPSCHLRDLRAHQLTQLSIKMLSGKSRTIVSHKYSLTYHASWIFGIVSMINLDCFPFSIPYNGFNFGKFHNKKNTQEGGSYVNLISSCYNCAQLCCKVCFTFLLASFSYNEKDERGKMDTKIVS